MCDSPVLVLWHLPVIEILLIAIIVALWRLKK
jgi:cytochrome c-type biogenesis protein CcmH/NrfF